MTETIRAELGAAADAIGSYRSRVARLLDEVGPNHEDLVSAMY
jgi:hypothetical protein